MDSPSPTHLRQLLAVFAAFVLLAALLSATLAVRGAHQRNLELAEVLARSTFESVVAARKWNAMHGGVYVPVTERFQPNPYLEDPLRDLTTTDGMRLTKINPAYMTRLIAGIDAQGHGVRVHLTSLRPLRPGNAPDPWERQALGSFVGRDSVAQEVTVEAGREVYRYMRPLVTGKPCLTCHAKQGYVEGEIRGGISVSFPYAPFAATTLQTRVSILAAHVAFVLIGWAVVAILGQRLLSSQAELEASRHQVDRLQEFFRDED